MKLKTGTSVKIIFFMPLSAVLTMTSFVVPSATAQSEGDPVTICMGSLLYTKPDAYGNVFSTGISRERAAKMCRQIRTPERSEAFTTCLNSLLYTEPDAYGNVFSTGISRENAAKTCRRPGKQQAWDSFNRCIDSLLYTPPDASGNRVPTGTSQEDAAIACRNCQS